VAGLSDRRSLTTTKITQLRDRLRTAETIAAEKACVYATGSFGRCEASEHSDLDLFILGKNDDKGVRLLTHLDEICVKADLIEVSKEFNFPPFSQDGRYLTHYSVSDLIKTLGTPEDDATNTLTARLLLLLESRPLLGDGVYKAALEDVVAAYWRDYEDHKNDFMPAFLTNDILRLWRTFCVNYEERTKREPDTEKAKGKIKNYKLKHSRLLTCYSAILYLLAVYGDAGTVSPQDALAMIALTPTERLEWLCNQPQLIDAHDTVSRLLRQYETFLETTSAPESELLISFVHQEKSKEYMDAAYAFGDSVFDTLNRIGKESRFHRLLVV